MNIDDITNRVFFNNTIRDYFISAAIILIGLLLIRIFKKLILERIKAWIRGSSSQVDDYVFAGITRFGFPVMYFMVFYFGVHYLDFSKRGNHILDVITTLVITILILRMLSSVILVMLRSYIKRQENGEAKVEQMGGLMLVINLVIWIVGIIFLFDNMGYNVTAIITGLGIGGIAVALAAQNILGDLFNYFVIFFDRPFEAGDFITVDDKMGTVEHVGIKTTRLKSLNGEQLIIANSDLTGSRIHNYKRMEMRRVEFKVSLDFLTPVEKLEEIPLLFEKIVEAQEFTKVDRSHFAAIADTGLRFEVVYFVMSSEYNTYMDIQQAINISIIKELKQREIELAQPIGISVKRNTGTVTDE